MARNGSGVYSLPAGNPVVTGSVISSTTFNNTASDIATALTQSISKDGQTAPTANLPMAGFKLTGLGDGASSGDSVHIGQLADDAGSSLVGHIQAGTGAVARTVQTVLRESLSVKDLGAVGDGATNDLTAFTNAFAAAAGKKLRIPAGNYRIEFTGGTSALTPPASIVIEGDGRDTTTITFVPSTTTLSYFFNLSNDEFTLRGVTIANAVPASGNGCVFKGGADSVTVEDCDIDGGVTNSGASLSHVCYGIICVGAGTQNDQSFRGNIFRRLTYPWLKANTDTAEQRRLKFVGNTFHSNYYNDLGLNSPSGVCDDVLIDGNTFRNNLSISASLTTQALGIALASVTNFRVVNNHVMDDYTDAIHIEEGSAFGVVSQNTMEVDGGGVSISGNNIGGSEKHPNNLVISNNVLMKQGTARESGKDGIRLIFNASSFLPAENLVISDNIVNAFDYGVYSVAGAVGGVGGAAIANDAVVIKDNLFKSCATGMGLFDGTLTVQGNTTNQCTVGIANTNSANTTETAVVESHTFISDTTYVDAIDRKITLIDPMWVLPEFDHAGGSTSDYKPVLPANTGDRIHGYFEVSADASGGAGSTGSSRARDEVTWDGTTFTRTSKLLFTAAGLQAQSARNSSQLAVDVFASVAMTGLRVNVRLNGMAVISV